MTTLFVNQNRQNNLSIKKNIRMGICNVIKVVLRNRLQVIKVLAMYIDLRVIFKPQQII